MSEILKDRAVILKSFEYGESSIVAVALTRKHGKVTFLAKGARGGKSPLQGKLRTGNLADVVYYSRPDRGFQLIKEISSDPGFDCSCGDLDRLCIFQAGLEVMDRSTGEREADERIFDLLEEFVGRLGACLDPWMAFFTFEVQLLALSGFYPSLDSCSNCKKELAGDSLSIDPSDGRVLCGGCRAGDAIELSPESGRLLCIMELKGLGGVELVELPQAERKEIGRVLHRIFAQHVAGYRLPNALRILKGAD